MSLNSALIFRRFLSKCWFKPLCYHSFLNASYRIRCFSAYPRFDFSCLREPDDAVDQFQNMLRMYPPPSVIDFTKLLSAVVKMRQCSVALHLFDEMLQTGAPINHYTFNIAIDCFCRLKRPDFGFSILGSFFKRGYEPDVVTFTTLIKGLVLVGRIPEAAKLLFKVSAEQLCNPNERTYNVMINGLCKAGGTLEALELLSRLEKGNYKLDVYAYNIVIDGLCKDRKVDDALQLFSTLGEKGISPDVVTYTSLIGGLCNHSRGKEVEDILRKMISHKVCPNVITYTILIGAMCKVGRIEHAKDLMLQMVIKGCLPNSVTYNIFVQALLKRNKMDDVILVLKEMTTRGGCTLGATTFSMLIEPLRREGEDSVLFDLVNKLLPKKL